jgi:hypothetical protein
MIVDCPHKLMWAMAASEQENGMKQGMVWYVSGYKVGIYVYPTSKTNP